MNVLIVLAHPEPASFNAALAAEAERVLRDRGDDVTVLDLYAMGFDPVPRAESFGDRVDETRFDLDKEQEHAHVSGTVSSEISTHQAAIDAADLIIFQFPFWWFSMPAMLKGWFDLVFTRGYAYGEGRKYDEGVFRGKRALLSITTGTDEDTYSPAGENGSMEQLLAPITETSLWYLGFDVLEPYVSYMPRQLTDTQRAAAITSFGERVLALA